MCIYEKVHTNNHIYTLGKLCHTYEYICIRHVAIVLLKRMNRAWGREPEEGIEHDPVAELGQERVRQLHRLSPKIHYNHMNQHCVLLLQPEAHADHW